jgi:hypothetical protein
MIIYIRVDFGLLGLLQKDLIALIFEISLLFIVLFYNLFKISTGKIL